MGGSEQACWGEGEPHADSWYLNTFTEYLFRLMMPRELKGSCINSSNYSIANELISFYTEIDF